MVLAGSCWAGSYAAVDVVAFNQLGHRRDLWAFWNFAFPPLPPRSAWDATWALRRFAYLFVNPLDFETPLGPTLSALVPLWLFVVGCVSLGRRDGRCLAMLALPSGFALLAAYLRVYPFHGRLVLFLVPSLLLFVAEGAGVVREKFGRGVAWWVVLGALFFFPTLDAAYRMLEPRNRADFNPRGDRRPAWSDPERFPYPIGEGAGLGLGLIQIPEILCTRAAD